MKLDGDVLDQEEEDDNSIDLGFTLPLMKMIVVGYALTAKKKKRFLQPKLLALGRSKGVSFLPIDPKRPLSEQGPFHIVLHKLFGKEWVHFLQEYMKEHPDVTLIDHPDAIRKVRNRLDMLQQVAGLTMPDEFGVVKVPNQLIVDKNTTCVPEEIAKSGLNFPLVVKPLIVDETSKSHELFLAFDKFSVSKLEPPLVLQEFINHGGVVFKVYVMGERVKVVRRLSLPNVKLSDPLKQSGTFRFPRVSSAAAASTDCTDLDSEVAELPPTFLLQKLARELGGLLGLHLFNIDMIREQGKKDTFYVIDINYFPGFGKVPGYEHMFMDFLLSLSGPSFKSSAG